MDAYEALLGEHGYSRGSTYVHLHIVADFSRWLRRRRLDAGDVDECTVERYLQSRQRFVDTYRGASFVPYKFLGMLRDRRIVTHKTVPIVVDPCEIVVDAFKQYLSQERGLSVSIQCNYTRFAHQFLRERFGRGSLEFSRCLPPMSRDSFDVTLTSAAPVAPNTSSVHYEPSCDTCDTAARLRQTLPPVCPRWRTGHYSTLPKFLQPGQVQQVLDHCDRHSALGLRNYAILVLLARLGLRACEIVAMTLDDIDWEGAHLMVRGKGGQRAQMPLSAEVGHAIAVYLRKGRPRCTSRRLFIREHAPRVGFANSCRCLNACPTRLSRCGRGLPAHRRLCIQTLACHGDA